MTNPHPHREVLIAIAEGRKVECKYSPDGIWNPITDNSVCNPLAQPQWEWRVRPEPHEPRRIWVIEYGEVITEAGQFYGSPNNIVLHRDEHVIEFVEVIGAEKT